MLPDGVDVSLGNQQGSSTVGGTVLVLVIVAVVYSAVSGGSLGDSSTCADWMSASADDKKSYVNGDGYYNDAEERVTDLDQICAHTSREGASQLSERRTEWV